MEKVVVVMSENNTMEKDEGLMKNLEFSFGLWSCKRIDFCFDLGAEGIGERLKK